MSILLADIDATCSSLGRYDGSKYYIEDDAIQSLKVKWKIIYLHVYLFFDSHFFIILAFDLDSST